MAEWKGLWEHGEGYFSGATIKKKDIPTLARIVITKNKYYRKNTNRPKYQYCIVKGEEYQNIIDGEEEKKPYCINGTWYTGEGERLYTIWEVQKAVDGATEDARNGLYENLAGDYV